MSDTMAEAATARADATIRLGARNISKSYGPVRANRDISLSVAPGEIHAIVGENGAGKSTLMRILQGMEHPDSGAIIVDDQEVRFSQPQQALETGIGMVHQEFMLAPDLTLLENLVLGDEPVSLAAGPLSRIDWAQALQSGEELAKKTGVAVDWRRRAGGTPVHIQQIVEIIRLLRRGTRILILDEPTAVLAPQQVEDLFVLLRNLRDTGTTILFISHKLKEVVALADRVTVIRRGEVSYSANVAETDSDTIARYIVGGNDTSLIETGRASRGKTGDGEVVLHVAGLEAPSLEKSHPLHGVSLSVRKGEIVGLAAVSGNGQDELVECLVGLRSASKGRVELLGGDVTNATNGERRRKGIAYISADRRHEGLATLAPVEDNVVAGSHDRPPIGKGMFLSLKQKRKVATERLASVDVRYGRLSDPVSSLSGGNQQRLVFAREIASDPKVMVVSQPTRGVDLNGIAAIHKLLLQFRDDGGSVLLVSEELEELLYLCDRIVVMAAGRIVGDAPVEGTDVAEIGRMMVMQGHADG